jgi:D-alanine transaminase
MILPRALANMNGVQMPLEEVKVSALDRGFLFGDAVYEVLRVYRGKPWLLNEHFLRFAASLEAVHIRGADLERMKRRMFETIAAGAFQEALAYLQVTRGVAPRRHSFPAGTPPTEFLYIQDFTDPYVAKRQHGVSVITHPDLRWQRCDIKSTNLLANILAMQAATDADCAEAILYLPEGSLTEATHSSFFAVLDGALVATPIGPSILPGITRRFLIDIASRIGVPFRQQVLHRRTLTEAAELLLTGTTAEVLPIVRVDGAVVGSGHMGPVTRRLLEAYQKAVAAFC